MLSVRSARRSVVLGMLLASALVTAPARAEGVRPDQATAEQSKAAEAHYNEGVGHFKAGRFGQAAESFRQSYDVIASPNSHMMLARSLAEQGNVTGAYEEMALAAAEASELAGRLPKYADTASKAEAARAEMGQSVGVLEITVKGTTEEVHVSVGKRQVPPHRWKLVAVQPGKIDVVARIAGGRRLWESVDVSAGEIRQVTLDLSSPPPPGSPPDQPPSAEPSDTAFDADFAPEADTSEPSGSLRPYAYVAAGVGAAGFVMFAVAGSKAKATYDDLQKNCPNDVCPADYAGDIDDGKRQKAIANAGLAIGALGVAVGATLFTLDLVRDGDSRAGRRVRLLASPSSVSIDGRF